jgi:hypothetical protein
MEDGHELFKLEPVIQLWGFDHLESTKSGKIQGYKEINGKLVAGRIFAAEEMAALQRPYKLVDSI